MNKITRRLALTDWEPYLELLGYLTNVGSVNEEDWTHRYNSINNNPLYEIWVVEDPANSKLLAAGTLLIEEKFIHSCGKVGHIEDIVVDPKYRSEGIGQHIVTHLKAQAKKAGCYKVILNCRSELTQFYEKSGFRVSGVEMRWDN